MPDTQKKRLCQIDTASRITKIPLVRKYFYLNIIKIQSMLRLSRVGSIIP